MNWIKRLGKNKILAQKKISPIHLHPGDAVELSLVDEKGVTHYVMRKEVDESYTLTEAMVFKIDDDDYRGLGGAFLEEK